MNLDSYLDALREDSARMAICAEQGDLAAPVDGCPGWDVRKLVAHTGFVHRWATHAIQNSAPADSSDVRMPSRNAEGEELGAWLRLGAGVLIDVLAATPGDADTWHPFPAEQKAWVWSRRQAMETMIHRWDAEVAEVGSSNLAPQLATAGLAEYFEMLLPRTLDREHQPAPSAQLHVHCTDPAPESESGDAIASEWTIWGDDGTYRMDTQHRTGDAAIRGSAADLLLAMMGRSDGDGLDIVGDRAAVAAWLDLPGL